MPDARTVLVAVDLGSDWNNVVDHAAFFAENMGAKLHLVHVIPQPAWLIRQVMAGSGLEPNAEHQINVATGRLERAAKAHRLDVTFEVAVGKPAEVLVDRIAKLDAALIVLGNNADRGSFFVGTVGDRVLRHSIAPVLVVGHKSADDYETVLVPTTLGTHSGAAIKVACALKSTERLLALHVIALPSLMRSYSGDVVGLRRNLVEAGQAALTKHISGIPVCEGVELEPILRATDETMHAAQAILNVATERDVDLIALALGSHRSPFILGRTAERLTRALPCSMLALPAEWLERQSS